MMNFTANVEYWNQFAKNETKLLCFEAKNYSEAFEICMLYGRELKYTHYHFEIIYIKQQNFQCLNNEWNKLLNEKQKNLKQTDGLKPWYDE